MVIRPKPARERKTSPITYVVATILGLTWLLLLGSRANQIMKFSVHILTTYFVVISVFCFWTEQFFWGVVFAIDFDSQFLYVMAVIDRFPFTMMVLLKAVKFVCNYPKVMRVACAFMMVMLMWLGLWSFGAAGVMASSMGDGGRWWLLVVSWKVLIIVALLEPFGTITVTGFISKRWRVLLSLQVLFVSLFWIGAVLCNTLHVIVYGMVFLVPFHGG